MTLHLTNPTRRLIITLLAVFAMVAAALPTAFLLPAEASHAGTGDEIGGFEIDGDAKVAGDPSLGDLDWQELRDLAPVSSSTMRLRYESATDLADSSVDDIMKGGSKENDPDTWEFDLRKPSGKVDLTQIHGGAEVTSEGAWLWMAFERLDISGKGDAHVNFEFNQSGGTVVNSKGVEIPERTEDDLLVAYDYSGGTGPVSIDVYEWVGTALSGSWDGPRTSVEAAGDINASEIESVDGEHTIAAKRFGEAGIDLASVFGTGVDSCRAFHSFWAKTRSSGESFDSNLQDMVDPIALDIDTCGGIEVQKQDAEGKLLDGATFRLYHDDGGTSGSFDDADSPDPDTAVTHDDNPCTTDDDTTTSADETGICKWGGLENGDYIVVEEVAPDGYSLPDPNWKPVTVQNLVTSTLTFTDPRIPYAIDVREDATNLIGDEHVFVVTLTGGSSSSDTLDSENQFSDRLANETVSLSWAQDAGSDSTITAVTDENQTDGTGTIATGGLSATCETRTEDGTTPEEEAGTCLVTVNSSSLGKGTLTATFDTPYQHDTGKTDSVSTADGDEVADTSTKEWVDYSASVGSDSKNLVGDSHRFTITADGPTGSDLDDPASKVGFWWDGTGNVDEINGSNAGTPEDTDTTFGSLYECDITADTQDPTTGTCTVTVTSSSVGTGTLTIAHIDVGDIDDDGDDDIVDYDVDGDGTDDATGKTSTSAQTADKSWVDYTAEVDDDSTNLVGDSHTFTVTAFEFDGDGGTDKADGVNDDSELAPDGVKVGFWWNGTGSVDEIDGVDAGSALETDDDKGSRYECTLSSSDGTCDVTVTSSSDGSGTLTIIYIDASSEVEGITTTVTYGSGTTDEAATGDQSATKTWADFNVVVGPDAENLVGEDHTFYIEVSSTDEGIDLNGHTVNYTWLAPDATEADAGACETGSTQLPGDEEETNGACAVTVDSEVTGQGTITIVSLVLTEGTVDGDDSTVEFDVTGETGPAADTATKTWIDYRVSVSPETDENLTGSNHVFTVLIERDSGDGDGFQPLADANPSLEITDGPGDILAPANLCASVGTDASGECTVTISSSETGTTTVRASYLGAAADSEAVTFGSNLATKKWVDYLIDVDPDRAVNPVGTTHTFTVTLQRIEDGVAAAAADESVALRITGPGDIMEVPAGTIDGDARSASCTTDAAGECDVTIASDEVGDTTLTAEYAAQVGESTGAFSDSGLKLWRSDPAIEIVKDADIEPTADGLKIINCNEDGCPETGFTFTVTNVGGVHLHDVTVTDDEFGPITLQDDELEVGESTTGTATYTPTREEIDAGFHENLGTATGVSPDEQTVQDTDPERVEIIEVLPAVIERPEPAPEPEPEPLPRTGTYVAWMSLTALLALLLGWSMLWLGRRHEIGGQA